MSGTNWDKIMKGATKTKHAPPKAKYIDPLVQGTFEGEYACADIAQAIAPRLRDSNSTVVFKALIVVHMLLRSGNIKYTYGVWSSKAHLLGLNTVTSGHDSVQNLTKYAYYLHTRLKTYASLGRDSIRDRGERRAEGRGDGGERLRGLTVEKGLLREVATLQKLMDTLLECRFYLEDKEDEVTMTALRLLVKDLLILFTSVNEGVINVLEHYFEMAQVDATTALKIYKSFCKQTEKVVTYLGVAKKMQNILNVPIPNLKHAPVSLAGSLEEYLKDPNFEQNRIEYKRNREIAEGKTPRSVEQKSSSSGKKSPAANGSSTPKASSSTSAPSKPSTDGNKAFVDFFEAIEQEQTSMFDPNTGSPNAAYFQQQAAFNPFSHQPALPISQMSLSSSMPFGALQPQMTGAMAFGQLQPQMTGAFGQIMPGGLNAFGQPQQPGMMQPQATGFLQPQSTGFNPFRQSMIMPQMTGVNPFGQQQQQNQQAMPPFGQSPQRPFSAQAFASPQNQNQQQQQSQGPGQSQTSVPQLQPQWTGMNAFQRPSSAPIGQQPTSSANTNSNTPQKLGTISEQQQQQATASPHPLAPQKTGSKNPFAPPPGSMPASPPKPPQPSMNQIAFQAFQNAQQQQQNQQQQQQQQNQNQNQNQQQPQQNGNAFGNALGGSTNNNNNSTSNTSNTFDFFNSSNSPSSSSGGTNQAKPQVPAQTGLMGSIASDFAFNRALSPLNENNNNNNNGTTPNNANNGTGLPFNSSGNLPSFTPTGSSSSFASPSGSTPSFNFSSGSNANTNSSNNTGGTSSSTSMFGSSAFGQQQQQQQPQQPLQAQATGFGGSSIKPFQPSSSFGANLYAQEQAKRQGSGSDQQGTSNNMNGAFGNSFTGNNNNNNSAGDLLGGGGGGGQGSTPSFLSSSNTSNAFGGGSGNNGIGSIGGGNNGSSSSFGTLQPQNTGTPNPFRMSMLPGSTNSNNNAFNAGQFGGGSSNSTNMFGNAGGSTPQSSQQQQQSSQSGGQWGSLI